MKINVVCNIDNGYSAYCGTMLTSLFKNNLEEDITVYLVTDFIDDDNYILFRQLAESYNNTIHIVLVDLKRFKDLPYGGKFSNISLATYYRLAIPQIIENIDKVLYLDSDIIVNKDIKKLWNIDISDSYLAAIEDNPSIAKNAIQRLKYSAQYSYFNAGVMLLNLKNLRLIDFTNAAFKYLDTHIDRILFHDQDVMNALLHEKIKYLPVEFNTMECMYMKSPQIADRYRASLHQALAEPYIIHYTGRVKPWFIECHHPYKDIYDYYHAMSPWAFTTKIRKYNKRQERFAYIVRQCIKRILSFCGDKRFVFVDK